MAPQPPNAPLPPASFAFWPLPAFPNDWPPDPPASRAVPLLLTVCPCAPAPPPAPATTRAGADRSPRSCLHLHHRGPGEHRSNRCRRWGVTPTTSVGRRAAGAHHNRQRMTSQRGERPANHRPRTTRHGRSLSHHRIAALAARRRQTGRRNTSRDDERVRRHARAVRRKRARELASSRRLPSTAPAATHGFDPAPATPDTTNETPPLAAADAAEATLTTTSPTTTEQTARSQRPTATANGVKRGMDPPSKSLGEAILSPSETEHGSPSRASERPSSHPARQLATQHPPRRRTWFCDRGKWSFRI